MKINGDRSFYCCISGTDKAIKQENDYVQEWKLVQRKFPNWFRCFWWRNEEIKWWWLGLG